MTQSDWREFPALQQPTYPDQEQLQAAVGRLRALPPLVTSWEIEALKTQLAEAASGKRLLLQGGDCAESFDECSSDAIAGKLKVLLQMSLVMVHGTRRPVVRVGRFAGQYAKPRSKDTETKDGVELPCYRGDNVNGPAFTAEDRTPNPWRLVKGHERAALTLNFIRSLIDGGFADLHHPEYWNLGFVADSPNADRYRQIVEEIQDSISFMETIAGRHLGQTDRVDFFTSHEGLHLEAEAALTREVPRRDGLWNLSTHLPWIGKRTNDPDGAHVRYFATIRNPVAVKIGEDTAPDQLRRIMDILHPNDEPGRLVLVHRFGVKSVNDGLERLIECVKADGRQVVWVCDPMHGNTVTTASGRKTRHFDDILGEVERSIGVHERMGTHFGGVHFELTGEDVTECTGGARNLSEADLEQAYRSQVDPRLNREQALEIALLVADRISKK